MKKCMKCGKNYDDTQKFCSECGGSLTAVQATVSAVGTGAQQDNTSGGFLANNWAFIVAILGYCASWIDGYAIFGTIVAAGAAFAGWMKKEKGFVCSNIACRIIATLFGILAILEVFMYDIVVY